MVLVLCIVLALACVLGFMERYELERRKKNKERCAKITRIVLGEFEFKKFE
jgi:hypothetical protein